MEAAAQPRRWTAYVWWAAAALLFVVCSIRFDSDVNAARQAGYVFGSLAIPLLVAAGIRWAYSAARKRPFWSPWILVIAAGIGLPGKLADAAKTAQQSERARAIVRSEAGSRSKQVRECVEGGLQRSDEASDEQRAALSRVDWETLVLRSCRQAERRGLLEHGFTNAQLTQIVMREAAKMRARGELPS